MAAPLYDALKALAESEPLRMHMPGHKGRLPGAFDRISALDFTELAPTGNLYTGEGPIRRAEQLFAAAAGARDALFFTCGATQGIFTMLSAAVGMGGTLLADRSCHKSVCHGMALLDISPVWLQPQPLPDLPLPSPISPGQLESALLAHPEAKAVLVTTPSYYGVITPLSPLAEICRAHGVYLLVDQAHGAHFPFVDLPAGCLEGADLCVVSSHKTLPALGSSSILYIGDHAPWDARTLKAHAAVFATTSPSYPILASIDLAREMLEGDAGRRYREKVMEVADLRQSISRETPFRALSAGPGYTLDPCRLTIDTAAGGLPGHQADILLQKQNIYVEMSDERYLVAIVTCCDRREDLLRFLEALKTLPAGPPLALSGNLPPAPVFRISLRKALFGPRKQLPLREAAGEISGQIVAPYPPGIPILAPGEEITEKHIAYLQKKSYNIEDPVWIADDSAG